MRKIVLCANSDCKNSYKNVTEEQDFMNLQLQGKRAFVAGSSDGIGKAIAEALCREGCTIMLCARNEKKLAAVRDDMLSRHDVHVEYVVADLDDATSIRHTLSHTMETLGAVDILVANNGGPPPGEFLELREEDWLSGYHRTLMSTVRLIRGVLPGMIDQSFGRIINITSIAVKQPVQHLLLSNTFRAGVTGMAKTLSNEVAGHGITVNNIAPGYISTNRLAHLFADRAAKANASVEVIRDQLTATIPAGRLGTPEEVAALAVFLASPSASYISGNTVTVDGGLDKGLL